MKEILSGAVAYEQEVPFDAEELSSGTYIVRAVNVIGNRPLTQTKIVVLK